MGRVTWKKSWQCLDSSQKVADRFNEQDWARKLLTRFNSHVLKSQVCDENTQKTNEGTKDAKDNGHCSIGGDYTRSYRCPERRWCKPRRHKAEARSHGTFWDGESFIPIVAKHSILKLESPSVSVLWSCRGLIKVSVKVPHGYLWNWAESTT